ncbi:hypothetical protein [uncultured Megamonas sp.]|uniref:hypothetical protein n=1 Tax=uncultured Megamonas sp. TaxID=286140 RepID=UPI00259B2A19|nr:hypothetical protein [uncultured Megamonas sp.]
MSFFRWKFAPFQECYFSCDLFTPLFEKAMLFDMSEKQSLLALVHWLNSEYGDKTTFFTVGTPIVEVEQIVEDSVVGKED